jgi:hypothetical protein
MAFDVGHETEAAAAAAAAVINLLHLLAARWAG